MAKGLGRGLSALFSDTEEAYENARAEFDDNAAGPAELPIEDIFPNPHQPRRRSMKTRSTIWRTPSANTA